MKFEIILLSAFRILLVRPIVATCIQSTRMLKKEVQAARSIMKPALENRRKDKENALKNRKAPETHNDATQSTGGWKMLRRVVVMILH